MMIKMKHSKLNIQEYLKHGPLVFKNGGPADPFKF